jgi:hypothetical protein
MWTLIRREIEDLQVYYLSFLLFSIGVAVYLAERVLGDTAGLVYGIDWTMTWYPLLCLGLAAMGVSQMYFDRARRLSAFLISRGVVRGQVFLARIAAGLIPNLLFTAVLGLTSLLLLKRFSFLDEHFRDTLISSLITGFLAGTACYGIGLAAGWAAGRLFRIVGVFCLSVILFTLLSIKGFGFQVQILFLCVTVSSTLFSWETYRTSSL